jgi:hypothetical protein
MIEEKTLQKAKMMVEKIKKGREIKNINLPNPEKDKECVLCGENKINEYYKCECGSYYCKIHFIYHKNNYCLLTHKKK